jgi:hypothetical protein
MTDTIGNICVGYVIARVIDLALQRPHMCEILSGYCG